MDFEHWKETAALVTAVVGVLTALKAVYEYSRQTVEKRASQFLQLRTSYRDNTAFQEIAALLLTDDPGLAQISWIKRFEFMAFFEDIAFLVNSGLLRKEVAHYMFGFDVLQAWRSDRFWTEDLRDSRHWALLRHFVEDLERRQQAGDIGTKRVHL